MHFGLQKYRIFLYKKTFCLGFYTSFFSTERILKFKIER